jgi:hypothetical protein
MADFEFEYDVADESEVIKYWQDILAKPIDNNPATDDDGSKHDVSTDPVYLASGAKGQVNRKLKDISAGKSIIIPVNPVLVAEPHVPSGSVNDCKKYAKEDEDTASEATVTIDDGVICTLKDLQQCRVHTQPFDVDVPKNGIADTPAGRWKAVADGYYIKLKPLPPGPHKINFKGTVDEPYGKEKVDAPWFQDITYNFSVK